MRTQPASLQTGQRQEGCSRFAAPLLLGGPVGMRTVVRTSPIRFMGTLYLPVPLARFPPLGLPPFEDTLDIAPGTLVVGDGLRHRVLDPIHWPGLQCAHQVISNQRG